MSDELRRVDVYTWKACSLFTLKPLWVSLWWLVLCNKPILTVQHSLSIENKQPFLCFSETRQRASEPPEQTNSSDNNTQSQW